MTSDGVDKKTHQLLKKPRSKQQRKNYNAIRKQLSNWALATSLALTGAGLIDLFSNETRFDNITAVLFLIIGFLALLVSLAFLYYMEDEEKNDDIT